MIGHRIHHFRLHGVFHAVQGDKPLYQTPRATRTIIFCSELETDRRIGIAGVTQVRVEKLCPSVRSPDSPDGIPIDRTVCQDPTAADRSMAVAKARAARSAVTLHAYQTQATQSRLTLYVTAASTRG